MPIVNMVNAEGSDDLNVEIWIRRTPVKIFIHWPWAVMWWVE